MRTLHINVLDKKATYLSRDGDIVCGNSDYMIEFAFDAEWDGYDEKTARFIWNGQYQDVKFVGTACYVPIVTHTTELRVGVYAGELSTTTSATISCQKSILCDSSSRGGTVIINGGGGGTNFIFANSKEELPDPSTVPENSVAFVPSEDGGGGTVSWNDLTDKPFGDENVTIEWDGDATGRLVTMEGSSEAGAYAYYKVSDYTPTVDELQDGHFTHVIELDGTVTANEFPILAQDLTESTGISMIGLYSESQNGGVPAGFVFPEAVSAEGLNAEAGIYFYGRLEGDSPEHISSLTYGSLKKLDPKYLPDDIGGLPVVELTDVSLRSLHNGEPVALSSEVAAVLENIKANERIFLSIPISDDVPYPVSLILTKAPEEGGVVYIGCYWLGFIGLYVMEGVCSIQFSSLD